MSLNGEIVRSIYRKPYRKWVDNQPLPRVYKTPDFAIFTGEDEQLTIEHISRFLGQCEHVKRMNF